MVGSLIAVTLFGLAVAALLHFLRETSLRVVLAEAVRQPRSSLLLAVLLTGVSYFVLTGYDVLALRYVGYRSRYRRTALFSFISYALSHNLGVSLLSGGSSRYRLYSSRGLSALDATRVVLFCDLARTAAVTSEDIECMNAPHEIRPRMPHGCLPDRGLASELVGRFLAVPAAGLAPGRHARALRGQPARCTRQITVHDSARLVGAALGGEIKESRRKSTWAGS